jgi:hypothetical protein
MTDISTLNEAASIPEPTGLPDYNRTLRWDVAVALAMGGRYS